VWTDLATGERLIDDGGVTRPSSIARYGDGGVVVAWQSQGAFLTGSAAGPPLAFSWNDGLSPEGLATSGETTYWTFRNGGVIRRRDVDGGISTIAQGENGPYSLAADDTGVYWLTAAGTLRHIRNGAVTTLASGFDATDDKSMARGIALTTDYVFWCTRNKVLRISKPK
jgi:hypothetical protein